MTDDLSALPEDVRGAIEILDLRGPLTVSGRVAYRAIRAELLRLAEDLHYANGVASLAMQHRDAAEAELAALKARIAEAPVASVRVDDRMHVSIGARSNAVDFVPLHTKHVALVKVEE